MRCLTIMDGSFTLSGGQPASHHMNYDSFARHFLNVFEELVVVGRVYERNDDSAAPVTGPGVRFVSIPAYKGPRQFLRHFPQIVRTLWGLFEPDTAYLLRVPGTLPGLFSLMARVRRVPFFVQCVADPADQLSSSSVEHPLRAVFRRAFMEILAWQCKAASASMYVTRSALQTRYPPNILAPTTNYTDLVLDEGSFVGSPRVQAAFNLKEPVLLNVGMMAQKYKGQDDLIRAARICIDRGISVRLNFIGDGLYRSQFEALAASLDISDRCHFLGKIPGGESIQREIDKCDLFVLPSRQEGLPRALMEAMARATPCIATNVGGNGELLQPEDLVPPDDPTKLADAICAALSDTRGLESRSARNLEVAKSYRFSEMKARRIEFYKTMVKIVNGQQ